ncbi:endonuclease [Photobacterium kishitanii]|nr:endonuclease [Photobacterium kishitanii]
MTINKTSLAIITVTSILCSTNANADMLTSLGLRVLTEKITSHHNKELIDQSAKNNNVGGENFKKTNFPSNFPATKRYLKKLAQVEGFGYTFYDNCKITFHGKNKMSLKPDLSTCNYKVRNFNNIYRAKRIEFEHIVPISWIGKQMKCWQAGGRKNCEKVSSAFNHAEANLVNLQPSVGEINGDRSYFRYADKLTGWDYGSNGQVIFSKEDKRLQPPAEFKGWIGRVHLYMKDTYGLKISSSYERMITAWSKLPATKRECRYNARIQKDFGSSNPLTTNICKSQHIG